MIDPKQINDLVPDPGRDESVYRLVIEEKILPILVPEQLLIVAELVHPTALIGGPQADLIVHAHEPVLSIILWVSDWYAFYLNGGCGECGGFCSTMLVFSDLKLNIQRNPTDKRLKLWTEHPVISCWRLSSLTSIVFALFTRSQQISVICCIIYVVSPKSYIDQSGQRSYTDVHSKPLPHGI